MSKSDEILVENSRKFCSNSLSLGKNSRGIYKLDNVDEPQNINQIKHLNNLTLFKSQKGTDSNQNEVEAKPSTQNERPVTPINNSILFPPKTYSELCQHVQRRIKPRPNWSHISVENQQSVGAVLLGEVNAIWSGFKKQVKDPFLTPKQNKELQRRITVHIVTVCEQLFLYFCEHIKVLNGRGVFSEEANMSRIRGEVATSAGKYLNLLSVRRHIIDDLRKTEERDVAKLAATVNYVIPKAPTTPKHLSFHTLIETTRPRKSVSSFNIAQEIKDMRRNMPTLDISEALYLFTAQQRDRVVEDAEFDDDKEVKSQWKLQETRAPRKVRRWVSEPVLKSSMFSEDQLLPEVDDEPAALSHRDLDQTPAFKTVLDRRVSRSAEAVRTKDPFSQPSQSTDAIRPREDLQNLMNNQKRGRVKATYTSEDDDEGSMPPLIQVITRRQAQDVKLEKLKQEGLELDERMRLMDEEEKKPLPAPTHPQPPFNQTEIPGYSNPVARSNVIIRSSDVHVPDKVELPQVGLKMFQPLYNDLSGDISPSTVKDLDANLFQDEELKEVYSEIMKTVPDDHLAFDNDKLIIKPVEKVRNLKNLLSSSTLTLPSSMRLINPNFKKALLYPPWAGEPQDLWERNGKPTSPASVGGRSTRPSGMYFPTESHGKALRAQASWMAWWKATINTDDYFKYLSTKDTDFLSVIYHFYNSEVSQTEVDDEERLALLEEERKCEEFVKELKAKKEEFLPGKWNVNVVKIGGLGKYPAFNQESLQEDLECSSSNHDDNEASRSSSIATSSSDSRSSVESREPRSTGVEFDSVAERRVLGAGRSSGGASKTGGVESSATVEEVIRASRVKGIQLSDGRIACSDADVDCSSLNASESAKAILSNVERRHSLGDRSSGYFSMSSADPATRKEQRYSEHRANFPFTSVTGQARSGPLKEETSPKKSINLLKGYYGLSSSEDKKRNQFVVDAPSRQLHALPALETSRSAQSRFEAVWRKLRMTSSQKVNAAAKYSVDKYIVNLDKIVSAWERVTDAIQKREKILCDLETFELEASNPHRYFYKGAKGSSMARLREAKVRAKYYRQLEKVEKEILPMLHAIHFQYNDVVTLEGRPYMEKMNADKIEMLYWLQQERRALHLNKLGAPEQLKQFIRDNHVTANEPIAPSHVPVVVAGAKIMYSS